MSENFIKLKSSFIKLSFVIIFAILTELYGEHFKEIYNTFGKIFYMLGGTYLTANLMSTPIKDFQNALSPYLPKIFHSDKTLDECIYKFNRLKSFIKDKKTVDTIEDYIKTAEIYLRYSNNDDKFVELIKKINFILTLYEPIPDIKIDINNVIEKFNDVVIDNKDKLISEILVPFILKLNGESNIHMAPIYLVGSPGVGKTFFINKMAEILDVPIITSILQPYSNTIYVYKFDESSVNFIIRSLHNAITTKKTRTFIMLIDEFDKKIARTSNILESMNNDNKLYDDYLGIYCDIGNIIPVCIGNKRISQVDKFYTPLENRFITIDFPKMTQETKYSIVYNILNIPHSTDIDTIINNDKFYGIRQLLMKINIYRACIMGKELFKGTSWENIIKKQLRDKNYEEEKEEKEKEEKEERSPSKRKVLNRRSKSPIVKKIYKVLEKSSY